MEKTCSECGLLKNLNEFYFIKARNRHMNYCRDCNSRKIKEYRKNSTKHQEYKKQYQQSQKYKATLKSYSQSDHGKRKHRENERQRRRLIKEQVIHHYSNGAMHCSGCGFDNIKALTIDHIFGGGNQHRKQINSKGGGEFYTWLRKNQYPEGFQVLCMNCQFIKKIDNLEHSNRID